MTPTAFSMTGKTAPPADKTAQDDKSDRRKPVAFVFGKGEREK
jgi:hypothetical protein